MSWTKRQFVNAAFRKIGLGSYAYDLDTEHLQDALADLDAMMAEWSEKGIKIGWPFTLNPENADLDRETEAPARANAAIYLNLGIRIAPDLGKIPTPQHETRAKSAYNALLGHYNKPPTMKKLVMPAGQGHRHRGSPYSPYNRFIKTAQTTDLEPIEENLGFDNE